MTWVTLAAGLAVLTVGAEALVRGAARLAGTLGIPPLIVGLTVVAFGTSAPELVVSLHATLAGRPDVALGNVVGSNNFNVLVILGASALVVPLRVAEQFVRFDVPVMIALSGLVLLLALDGRVGGIDGALLTTGLVLYIARAVLTSRGRSDAEPAGAAPAANRPATEPAAPAATEPAAPAATEPARGKGGVWLSLLWLAGGLAALALGSRLFVDAATELARGFGVSELVIGLTVVAAGTSLPEAATSILAAVRGERDIAVGNVVGSNIFNLLGVLGLSALLSGGGVTVSPAALRFDLPVMVAVAVVCLPIFWTGQVVARWEGALLLAYYAAYTGCLFAAASGAAWAENPGPATLAVVLLLAVAPVALSAALSVRARGRSEG
ncbi:calcium/sodium antiporter [Alienimonas sp. DA493]|uniref:calcium/sodium antiporter n=1 Tax=Alienimonas sp. DA493 TaxID=3373605 RepID=UPI0037544A09